MYQTLGSRPRHEFQEAKLAKVSIKRSPGQGSLNASIAILPWTTASTGKGVRTVTGSPLRKPRLCCLINYLTPSKTSLEA